MNIPTRTSSAATRSYRLGARADSMQATRDRILDAVGDALMTRWYDEVTFAELARAAGVSSPTLTNHFGDKHGLISAYARERVNHDISELRFTAEPGDIAAAIRVLLDDYERTGDMVIRALALEHRYPELTEMLTEGRAGHRAWVTHVFGPYLPARGKARTAAVTRLVLCTDVYAWQLLRRDMKHSRAATQDHLTTMATAIAMNSKEENA